MYQTAEDLPRSKQMPNSTKHDESPFNYQSTKAGDTTAGAHFLNNYSLSTQQRLQGTISRPVSTALAGGSELNTSSARNKSAHPGMRAQKQTLTHNRAQSNKNSETIVGT